MADPVRTNAENNTKETHPWLKQYPANIDWFAEIPADKTMVDMFDESVRKYGDNTCLNFMGKKYTYNEIGDMVDKVAKGFQDEGIGKGSKVGLCLPNCPQYVISYYAALKVGATVVNFNPLYAEKQIQHQIEDSKTDIMVTLDLKPIYPKVEKMLSDTRLKKIVVCDLADALPAVKGAAFGVISTVKGWLKDNDGRAKVKKDHQHLNFSKLLKSKGKPAPVQVDAEDVAVLQYTGGTTGVPKAAMLTHRNLYANTVQTRMWFADANDGKEKLLAVLPFFHVFAMTAEMNLSIKIGAELVMLPKFNVQETMQVITKEKPTVFAGVPTIYHAMNKALEESPKARKKYNLSSLRHCISGGAPLPQAVKEAFEKNTGCNMYEGYGLSETSPVALANPAKGVQKTNSIGLPVPGTLIKLMDLEFPDKEVAIGMKGEICLKGPQVMKGYWQKPEETKNSIGADGYLRTGDVGYMDADGYVFIVDRIKDMIIAGGYNVYPRKVEDAIMKHPSVSEVIVAGVKDEYRGETVQAFIVLKTGATLSADELKTFLSKEISPIEMPKKIEFRDTLPKTLIGKPSRKDLLEEIAAKAAANQNKAPEAPVAVPAAKKVAFLDRVKNATFGRK